MHIMINNKQTAIIKKDLKAIVFDKTLFPTLLIVPAVFTIILPTVFIMAAYFGAGDMEEFQQLINLLPATQHSGNESMLIVEVLMNNIMPMFFLLIPIMAAMIMAASSFVGEKENRTLETLLYSPLSLKQIFVAKILASFLLSMIVSFASFLLMILVVEAELLLTFHQPYIPNMSWLINMLLVSPSIACIAITLIVRGSAKAKTMQESQQNAVFLIFPILALIIGQFTGIILVGPLLLFCMGIIFAFIALLLMKRAIGKFSYETLLK